MRTVILKMKEKEFYNQIKNSLIQMETNREQLLNLVALICT